MANVKMHPASSCRVRTSRWTPLGLALLCGHCAVTGLVAGLAVFGGGTLTLLGVDLNYVWPPVLILGLFAWWLWSGREKADACEIPADPTAR